MPGKVAKIGTFSDWVGMFDDWRKEIGVNHDEIADFKFDTLYGAIETEEILPAWSSNATCSRPLLPTGIGARSPA